MNLARNIGFHLQALLKEKDIAIQTFSKDLDFPLKEMYFILEGRKILPPFLLKEFADYFEVNPEYFLNPYTKEESIPEHTYLFQFSNPKHIDEILDLIDDYADLKEMCT